MAAIRLFFAPLAGGLRAIERKYRIRINRHIRVPEVRVIGSDGGQLGVLPTDKAIGLAEEQGLDLVEVSPTAVPPVCRIVDFGKYKYERNKRLKQSKKKQHTVQVKEIKFRPKTEEHDYQFKKRHAEDFLSRSYRVKFTVVFRGRELDHKEMGDRILGRIRKDLAHLGLVERGAQFEGRLMTMFMAPVPGKHNVKPNPQKTDGEGQDAEAQIE